MRMRVQHQELLWMFLLLPLVSMLNWGSTGLVYGISASWQLSAILSRVVCVCACVRVCIYLAEQLLLCPLLPPSVTVDTRIP